MAYAQLFCLIIVLISLYAVLPIKNKILSILISFLFSLIFIVQLSSVLLTGEIADYRFYENFSLSDSLSIIGFFKLEAFILILGLILTTLFIYKSRKILNSYCRKTIIPLGVLLLGFVIMSLNGGIINNAYHTLLIKSAGKASFNNALSALNVDPNVFDKESIIASKGKNIIVLSLESLEKGYLIGNLKHLTPNLNKLAKNHTLLDMEQSPAGAWTSASMYITMTGVPAFFNDHGNSVFQGSAENKLPTLPATLKKAGYNLQYFIGKKEFSGINDLLKTHEINVNSEKDFKTKYKTVPWGMQDMDLFKELKKELLNQKGSNKPFAFFLSTIGTHFPDGVPDERIKKMFPEQKSQLELMALATDHFVGDLISFLKKEKMLNTTRFFIYPDHLLMGNNSRVINDFNERSLYFLTNAPKEILEIKSTTVNQIDIPKLILNGANIKHNTPFLTDFILGDKNTFLKKNTKNILQLNNAALTTFNLESGFIITFNEKDKTYKLKDFNGHVFQENEIPVAGKYDRVLLNKKMKPLENKNLDFFNKAPVENKNHIDIFKSNNDYYVSLKGERNYGISKKGTSKISFNKKDLDLFHQTNSVGLNTIILNSFSWNAKGKKSNFIINNKKITISRGLTILSLNKLSEIDYKTFDTFNNENDANAFILSLKKLEKQDALYVIIAHDSAVKSLKPFTNEVFNMGFEKLSQLKDREAYIMHNLEGEKLEYINDRMIALQIPYPKNIQNKQLFFANKKIKFKPNIRRYIAHAGGEIDKFKYTNSLETLNHNYSKGFRLFELDISTTSDGHYVATHDWKHWQKQTKYKGSLPVSLAEFKKHKIYGKYTPLDISLINEWFKTHPDATLITDKVNSPVKFGNNFIDKSRLWMELFSVEAVRKAKNNNINPIISEKVIAELKGNLTMFIKDNAISHVALSRRNINNKRKLLDELRKNGVHVYVYHVNFDKGKDEKYVFDNEIGIVYGMYADKWINGFNP